MYRKKAVLTWSIIIASALALNACSSDDDDDNAGTTPTTNQTIELSSSDVDFSNCREIAGGIPVSKASVQALAPEGVNLISVTEMGFVFEGSDDLGMLIIRSLSCESISVTDNLGNVTTNENVAFAHVGVPLNPSNMPSTTYSNDGKNGGDFNIYTLSYQTSSPAYFGAMQRAGLQNASLNEDIVNELVDINPDECNTANLTVDVPGDSEFSFSINGEVVEATADCHPGGVDFIANWWSVDDNNQVTALSNEVFGQTFTDTAGPDVFVVTSEGTTINDLIGADSSTFTGFSGSGYIPSGGIGTRDMVAEPLGTLTAQP